jgi:hypothetical protein
MRHQAHPAPHLDRWAAAFEHSITWEDDIWRTDPVDVEEVHAKARRRFAELLDQVTAPAAGQVPARILLFHGQSGAGKTHLIRALRTAAHRRAKAYFGYAQMTPDVADYADFYLRRLINSFEKPYDPDGGTETALQRLTNRLVGDADSLAPKALERLREGTFDENQLAKLVLELADRLVAAPKFDAQKLDINIVRALLYLQRSDPRIDQRVRQYLYGRQLTELSHQAVAALEPNTGEGRAFEIIESLGGLIWTVDRAALVFCIDQVEDLRFFEDYPERFQKAVRDLIQIANRLPTSIILISCLGDFYDKVRKVLAQSYIDRIEKSGPVPLIETRTGEEARLIIAKRLQQQAQVDNNLADASAEFTPQFFEEFSGLSTRRLLELAQTRCRQHFGRSQEPSDGRMGFIARLAAALGGGLFASANDDQTAGGADLLTGVDFRSMWERFNLDSEAEIPSDDQELLGVLSGALTLARDEWGGVIDVEIARLEVAEELPAIDVTVRHKSGFTTETRIFLCNRPTQGGGLKRQLDRVLAAMTAKSCFLLRASDFPPNKKNQTAQAFRKFREKGGRSVVIPISDWERMMTVREFHAHHRHDPGYLHWFEQAKLLSGLVSIVQLLRLDLLGHSPGRPEVGIGRSGDLMGSNGQAMTFGDGIAEEAISVASAGLTHCDGSSAASSASGVGSGTPLAAMEGGVTATAGHDWVGWRDTSIGAPAAAGQPAYDDELPLAVILDENGEGQGSIRAGRDLRSSKAITLNKNVLKRHAAVLGGSGSGKTTLALCIIEQLLLKGIPAVLIDRKGDLCSYANPDVWRALDGEIVDRRGEREKLADSIDVAVYTPGRSSGRPISITLLPTGINELPEHEQQLLANLSAAALGEMLHLKNSATHQKQSGTLSVALRLLGSRFSMEVTLGDLIHLLEEEDPELTELTQRMDPSGKIRRDLVAQLDSLRHRNSSLFEAGGESLRMEALLGIGPFARTDNRTRLSIIYTGFLGDNENILFWVSQFLSEALRFCQRNPNDALQAVVMFDEADLYIPANGKPATAEPLQSLLKRARSAGLGLMLATQSPGDLDYKSRDQITSWFIGRVREDTALRKLKAAFQSESGLDPAAVLPGQTVGEFHLVQEGLVRAMKAQRSLIDAEQVPFDRIEQLARENKGHDEKQLRLFA